MFKTFKKYYNNLIFSLKSNTAVISMKKVKIKYIKIHKY